MIPGKFNRVFAYIFSSMLQESDAVIILIRNKNELVFGGKLMKSRYYKGIRMIYCSLRVVLSPILRLTK